MVDSVPVALNIKSEEAHRLTREVAELTGESMTAVVTNSVRERRDRLRAQQKGGLGERILEISRRSAERLPAELKKADPDELLYGPDGLPR